MVAASDWPLQDDGGSELARNRGEPAFRPFRRSSCPQWEFVANWTIASTFDPPRSSRVQGFHRLIKLLAWVILAGCVGAVGGSSAASRAVTSLPSSSLAAPAQLTHAYAIHANDPASPSEPSESDAIRIDFDPESESDDEARLVPVGGLDRDSDRLLNWLNPATSARSPRRPPRATCSPRWFPIRC